MGYHVCVVSEPTDLVYCAFMPLNWVRDVTRNLDPGSGGDPCGTGSVSFC